MPDKPRPLTPANVDSPNDDPKKALLIDLKTLIDRYNALLAYLGSAAGKDIGTDDGKIPLYDTQGGIAGLRLKATTAQDGLVRLASAQQARDWELGDAVVTLSALRRALPPMETAAWTYKMPVGNSRKWGRLVYSERSILTPTRVKSGVLRSQPQTISETWVAPETAAGGTYSARVVVSPAASGEGAGTTSFGSLLSATPDGQAVTRDVRVRPGSSYRVTVGRPPLFTEIVSTSSKTSTGLGGFTTSTTATFYYYFLSDGGRVEVSYEK